MLSSILSGSYSPSLVESLPLMHPVLKYRQFEQCLLNEQSVEA